MNITETGSIPANKFLAELLCNYIDNKSDGVFKDIAISLLVRYAEDDNISIEKVENPSYWSSDPIVQSLISDLEKKYKFSYDLRIENHLEEFLGALEKTIDNQKESNGVYIVEY